ncbi:MAG: hypothetical protein RMJ97_04285 [Raineya sp.]|nr:hypothetical protein [Raineya sp.]MDW8296083.1 hypothetical protein [Raineya sp.]
MQNQIFKEDINQEHFEKVIQTDEFKGYFRKRKHLTQPFLLLFIGVNGIISFFNILNSYQQKPNYSNLVVILIYAFILLGIFVTGFGIWQIIGTIRQRNQAKMRVRVVVIEKIVEEGGGLSIQYHFKNKMYKSHIPDKWLASFNLPQRAVIYTCYYTRKLLKIEFLESGEILSVADNQNKLYAKTA